MTTQSRGTIFVPRRSFITHVNGRMLRFYAGRTTVREGHPILEGLEQDFRPLTVEYDVVQAPAVNAGGLSRLNELRARASELGLPASGKAPDLEAAIAAEEQRRAQPGPEPPTAEAAAETSPDDQE